MKTTILLVALLLSTSEATALGSYRTATAASEPEVIATANFADKLVRPDESIELLLSRALNEGEQKIAVMIGSTDVTGLFTKEKLRLRYSAKLWQLPPGESPVTVYLVSKDDQWREIAQFTLRVRKEKDYRSPDNSEAAQNELDLRANFIKANASGSGPSALDAELTGADGGDSGQQPAASPQTPARKNRIKFTPSLTLTIPSQPAQSTFPDPQPERATFIELNMQASLKNEATYGILNTQSSFDFAGSSFQKEALRFGTEGNGAPKVDLSSYLIQFQIGKVKAQVGHFSYGTQRQLINSFSSRGIEITVPFLKRFDFSAAAMNGTQLVGYGNFFGLNKSTHQMLSGTLGVELIRKRPGGLRL